MYFATATSFQKHASLCKKKGLRFVFIQPIFKVKFKSKIHNIAILLIYSELCLIRCFLSKKSSVYISGD